MLTFAHVLDLLADELAGLRARRLALTLVAPGSLQCLFLRHTHLLLKTFQLRQVHTKRAIGARATRASAKSYGLLQERVLLLATGGEAGAPGSVSW